MAGLSGTITIEFKTRICKVRNEYGYFHIWEYFSQPSATSTIGGAPDGQFSKVYGIVEFKDGVRRVDPIDIKFCDEDNAYLNEMEVSCDE